MNVERIVIIGAGQAGIEAAAELRRLGFAGTVTVVGRERHAPYQRPPLSKDLPADSVAKMLDLYPLHFYEQNAITLMLGRRVVSVDRALRRVRLDTGDALDYDHLLFATGSRPRPLLIDGLDRTVSLRTLDDAKALDIAAHGWTSVVIVGGGFIGLELACALRSRNIDVTLIEAATQLMGRVVSPTTAAYSYSHHGRAGTDIRLGRIPVSARFLGTRWALELDDGGKVSGDAVVAAVGALANDDIAVLCGLTTDRGIVVDATLRSSDPAISAIGDCCVHPDHVTGQMVRLESVQNAVDQAKAFAAGIVGEAVPYRSVPWFWSTQGDAKLQIAGLALGPTDDIVRPTPEGRLSVFRFAGDRLAAVETVNQPGDHLVARRLLAAAKPVSRASVANPTVDLRSLL